MPGYSFFQCIMCFDEVSMMSRALCRLCGRSEDSYEMGMRLLESVPEHDALPHEIRVLLPNQSTCLLRQLKPAGQAIGAVVSAASGIVCP